MKRLTIIIMGIVSVLLVAGAVFTGARLLNSPGTVAGSREGEIMMVTEGGAGGPVTFSLDLKPAPELPDRPAEVAGLFVRREDNSIFVGTGDIEFIVELDEATGQRQSSADFSGPVLEVVVTHETTIYRDETKFPDPSSAKSGTQTIQQVIQPVDSLDDLGEETKNVEIQVWGTRSGDRVVAEVFVYRTLPG
jgi:hypothetical protein